MVKLELHDGRSLFIRPESVRTITSSGTEGCSSVARQTETYTVKGSPDEVYAKLFPVAPGFGFTDTERNEAMLEVLEAVAKVNDEPGVLSVVTTRLVVTARKALGR
jgi:hypothetical protein